MSGDCHLHLAIFSVSQSYGSDLIFGRTGACVKKLSDVQKQFTL